MHTKLPTQYIIQEAVPKEAQGRVFSLAGSMLSISTPVGLLIMGPVAERYGVSVCYVIAGVAVVIILLLYLLISQTYLRRKSREKSLE